MTELQTVGPFIRGYDPGTFYDEMYEADGTPREHCVELAAQLARLSADEFEERRQQVAAAFLNQGIGFSVYGQEDALERIFPFDLVPRIVPADEWQLLERGLVQRVSALNAFLADVYGAQRILREGRIPPELVFGSANFRREVVGVEPPGGVYAHVAGIDVIRDDDGTFYVLEDNLRTPSGASYMLENRLGDEARLRSALRALRRARDRPVPAGAARSAPGDRPAVGGRADDRAAHAGDLQLGVLRALVPRPSHGRRARRGRRPDLSTTTSSTCARRGGCSAST